jgi:hypothetical protein
MSVLEEPRLPTTFLSSKKERVKENFFVIFVHLFQSIEKETNKERKQFTNLIR